MATEKVLTIGATGIEEIEIETGSGGGSDDGVTKDNFVSKFRTYDIVHRLRPVYCKDGIGTGAFQELGRNVGSSLISIVNPFICMGSVTGAGASYASNSISPGTTATGYARRLWAYPLSAETTNNRYNKYLHFSETSLSTNPNRKLILTASCYFSALSNGTDSFTGIVSLGGPGPTPGVTVLATHTGIHATYTHGVNSGNWVLQYRNTGGTLTTINTAVPAGVSASSTFFELMHDRQTGTLTVSLSTGLGAPTVYTITDYDDGDTYPLVGYVTCGIQKASGTAVRYLNIYDIAMGMTFA